MTTWRVTDADPDPDLNADPISPMDGCTCSRNTGVRLPHTVEHTAVCTATDCAATDRAADGVTEQSRCVRATPTPTPTPTPHSRGRCALLTRQMLRRHARRRHARWRGPWQRGRWQCTQRCHSGALGCALGGRGSHAVCPCDADPDADPASPVGYVEVGVRRALLARQMLPSTPFERSRGGAVYYTAVWYTATTTVLYATTTREAMAR
jgi:hypothetical protein